MTNMPNTKELFELRVVTDDPRFEGFALTTTPSVLGRASLDEDIVPGFDSADNNPSWKQKEFGKLWVPPKVIGRVAPFNDYPGLDMMYPAFSERAVNTLVEYLQPNGEILPLLSETRIKYFFYNITTISDALDQGKSKCEFWCDPPTTADAIDWFSFQIPKLEGLSIFRLREWPAGVIVSSEFVQTALKAGLNGFDFVKIWPLDSSENWRKRNSKTNLAHTSKTDLKAQTLVFLIPLRGKKADASERKAINKIEDEIDAQLIVSTLGESYFGSLEGTDIVDSQVRIFLSTPDVEKLMDKLHPWFDSLVWQKPVGILKRFGELHDPNAVEEFILLPAGN